MKKRKTRLFINIHDNVIGFNTRLGHKVKLNTFLSVPADFSLFKIHYFLIPMSNEKNLIYLLITTGRDKNTIFEYLNYTIPPHM